MRLCIKGKARVSLTKTLDRKNGVEQTAWRAIYEGHGLGGLAGESGTRLRLEVTSRDFETLRPMDGLVFHF
jgi:hypothetical protein